MWNPTNAEKSDIETALEVIRSGGTTEGACFITTQEVADREGLNVLGYVEEDEDGEISIVPKES